MSWTSPSNSARAVLALAALAWAAPAVRAQEDSAAGDHRARTAMWATPEPIAFTLRFDRKTVYGDRDTTSTAVYPGVIAWADASGAMHDLPVSIRTRGHFRLATRNCETPPLRLRFRKEDVKGTPFAGQRNLKLVNACRPGAAYDEFVRREYAVYRVANLLTDWSLGARLAVVTFVDAKGSAASETQAAMLLEHDDDVGRRHGAKPWTQGPTTMEEHDTLQMLLVGVFEYLIGNTDWSLPAEHNIRIYQQSSGAMMPVPYDFDWSGLVEASYARPDARLGITSVRQRLYRGPCGRLEAFAPVFDRFRAARSGIEAIYTSMPGLSRAYVAHSLDYIAEFYRTIDSPDRWKREIARMCAGNR